MKLYAKPNSYSGGREAKYPQWALLLVPVFMVAALFAGRYPGAQFAVWTCWGLAGLSLVYGFICLLCRHARWGSLARTVRQIIHGLLALFVISFIAIESLILTGARSDPEAAVDCVLVLGAGLRGETPSIALAVRLDRAAAYLERYPDVPVVVSGGQGPGEAIAEAEAMYRYLTARGVDPERIIRESRSSNTSENVALSVPLMPEGTTRVAVVSNEFHLYRARALLRRAGMQPLALSAPTPLWYLKPVYYFREYFSVIFMWLGR